jgi:hypothetical protein
MPPTVKANDISIAKPEASRQPSSSTALTGEAGIK